MDQGQDVEFVNLGGAEVELDLTQLPTGKTYEDCYRGYLRVFEQIAHIPSEVSVIVHNTPWSWVPLLHHLNCEIRSARVVFDHCELVKGTVIDTPLEFDRTAVEVLCGFRPECVDALWKCDMQWDIKRERIYPITPEFIVTNNGSFHRREVKHYMERLKNYVPSKKKVILMPCAADKPYPAPIHQAVMDIMDDDWYIMCVTGVIGLIPQDLWDKMPHYDSGIPNEWRVYNAIKTYFNKFEHDRILVFLDFYSLAVNAGMRRTGQHGCEEYIIPPAKYDDYLDLTQPAYLGRLKSVLASIKDDEAREERL